MIEIQHGVKLFIVFYETHILGIGLKMDSIRVVYIVSYQSFNDLFEVKPSRNKKKLLSVLTYKKVYINRGGSIEW